MFVLLEETNYYNQINENKQKNLITPSAPITQAGKL